MKKIIGIIPARFASTRFPGKPLADIAGKPMIERVYTQAKKAKLLQEVVIATDDARIFDAVLGFGGKVVMTNLNHKNGTERCAEVAALPAFEADGYINIQGDEPFIFPEQIDQIAALLQRETVKIATLKRQLFSVEDVLSPTIVKVVTAKDVALYFSRSPIPFFRNAAQENWLSEHTFFKHIGIYGFQRETLREIIQLPESNLENAEQLEQLRWLENGYTIHVQETDKDSFSVDVVEDVVRILREKSKI